MIDRPDPKYLATLTDRTQKYIADLESILSDDTLENATSAIRKLCRALDQAGLDAARHLTEAETDACVKLSGMFPADRPIDTESVENGG